MKWTRCMDMRPKLLVEKNELVEAGMIRETSLQKYSSTCQKSKTAFLLLYNVGCLRPP